MKNKLIKEILTSKVITVSPETKMSEVIAIMMNKKISCIIVTQNKKPVGIFTERDVVKAAYIESHIKNVKIMDVMTKSVLTVNTDINIYEIYDLLITKNIRHLVVVDSNGDVTGVVTQTDIINNLGLEYFFEVKNISKVMIRNVVTVKKEGKLALDMLSRMAKYAFSCIIVEHDNKPVGIFTERDVVRLVNEGTDISTSKVQDIMSSPIVTITVDTPLYDAVKIMNTKKIRRLIVVDINGSIIGLITQFDIIKGIEAKYIDFLKQIIQKKEKIILDTEKDLLTKTAYLENILRTSTTMAVIASDLNFKILYFNPIAEKIYGYSPKEILGRNVKEIHKKENVDPIRFDRAIQIVKKKGEYNFMSEQKREGSIRYLESRCSGIWDLKDRLVGFVLISQDITDRRLSEQRLEHMAHFDLLTDLPNRILFFDRLNHTLALAKREKSMVCLFYMDLDGFKLINDTMGHHIGDLMLKESAKRMKQCVARKSDTIARLSGDEFAIISRLKKREDASVIARKINEIISKPFYLDGHKCSVSVSIGINIKPFNNDCTEKIMLKNADTAMYRVKQQGRNSYQFFD